MDARKGSLRYENCPHYLNFSKSLNEPTITFRSLDAGRNAQESYFSGSSKTLRESRDSCLNATETISLRLGQAFSEVRRPEQQQRDVGAPVIRPTRRNLKYLFLNFSFKESFNVISPSKRAQTCRNGSLSDTIYPIRNTQPQIFPSHLLILTFRTRPIPPHISTTTFKNQTLRSTDTETARVDLGVSRIDSVRNTVPRKKSAGMFQRYMRCARFSDIPRQRLYGGHI